jgi:hypothetical protein
MTTLYPQSTAFTPKRSKGEERKENGVNFFYRKRPSVLPSPFSFLSLWDGNAAVTVKNGG